ncbi:MAG TPA: hypothetical protein VFP54_10935 [Acidimicrobiales bacterium]|nr:hypothetical protein [Acidimicrobiales bacterium]
MNAQGAVILKFHRRPAASPVLEPPPGEVAIRWAGPLEELAGLIVHERVIPHARRRGRIGRDLLHGAQVVGWSELAATTARVWGTVDWWPSEFRRRVWWACHLPACELLVVDPSTARPGQPTEPHPIFGRPAPGGRRPGRWSLRYVSPG